ncbi:type 4a pilus biogenesis protein PilO [Peribacillus alkalitolerans]|uniref:LysM peptidoglycan-binding domain-containing protein n=1 Tax=Peribacillus alkalitolerans TaxID=1550385 RepID=UPI0013D075F0|nr:type 4a pilus biogenesis protein PilO [Peribacillus alkalitolerans]
MDSRKKFLTFIVIIIGLGTLGFGYAFWFHFLPLKERISSLSTMISAQEEKLGESGSPNTEKTGEIITQTTELQKKLPVAPLVDQFILELERAEVESGSLITSFNFGQNQSEVTSESENNLATEIGNAIGSSQSNSTTTDTNVDENGKPIETMPAVPLPEGVEQLTVSMTVESPSYFELEAFIKAIEELPRITKIDNLTFTGQREVREATVPVTKLTYSVTVSTFYFPKLEDLKSQLPKYEKPAPSEKINPLVPVEVLPSTESSNDQSDSKPSENEASSEDSTIKQGDNESEDAIKDYEVVEKNGNSYKVYKHRVESGDTFFSLAMNYYSDPEEQKTIKSWNGISRLLADQTIEIPVPYNP